ncbi:MAG: cytochrome b N-terminal domain-containing protein [Polyangiales bacterium]
MVTRIADWLEERTGYRALLSRALDEEIAGGARFVYVFGTALTVIFVCQLITGLLLMATYTASVNDAWSSVFYIQHKVTGGWFVRGLHAHGAEMMIIVLGLHLMQVALYGAYKKPREVNWWLGLALIGIVQVWALTGNPLPWDEHGYWGSKIETSIMGSVPVIGTALQRVLVGGSDHGQSTLTHFYVLHVGVLPVVFALLIVAHIALFRRHGPTPPVSADLTKRGRYFPDQIALDVAFAVFVMLAIAIWTAATGGAPLTAPVDPSLDYSARPVWYFLFLYKMRIMVPPALELLSTLVLPGIAGGFLFALPFLDHKAGATVRERLRFLAPLAVGGLGILLLTGLAKRDDAKDEHFVKATEIAHKRAKRSVQLAVHGIPPGGPLEMLMKDPQTRGPRLYSENCATCHVLDGEGEYDAPVHTGFASRAWIDGLLHDPQDPRYFGRTTIDDMKSMDEKLDADERKAVIEFLYAEGAEPGDPAHDAELAKQGLDVFKDKCADCHLYKGEGADTFDGPDMTGYGSLAWLSKQIKDPKAIYGDLNTMTAFGDDMTDSDVMMVSIYLRQQRWAEPEKGPLKELPPPKKKESDEAKEKSDE